MLSVKTKEPGKPAVLLSPHRLSENQILLQTLKIIKNNSSLHYEVGDMNTKEFRILFPAWPKDVQQAFNQFGREAIDEAKKEIRQRHSKQRAGQSFDTYFSQAILRHYHQLFEHVKPYAPMVKWYHTRKLNGQKHYTTAPCIFSTFRPRLQFEVEKTEAGLKLNSMVDLNGQLFALDAFNRQFFFLESGNEYFILSFRDYQTLEWLREQDPAQYASQPAALAEHILSRLEKDYTVNRNNLFDQQEITAVPVNRVMLSELNNTFLMLTPQWLYDGYLIDGPFQETFSVREQGQTYSIKRNKELEQGFLGLLESLHPNFPKQINGYYYLSFADAQKKQWFLKTYHHLLVSDIELVGMDMLKHFRFSGHQALTEMEVIAEDGSKLTLRMSVKFGKEEVLLSELQKMLWAGQTAVLLKDGSLGVLGDMWLKQYAAIVKHGKVSGKEISIARWMAITEQSGEAEEKLLEASFKMDWWQRWQQWQSGSGQIYPVPGMVKASLRPYQQKGYEWMRLLAEAGAGGCLADDMGLGKTLQAICFLASAVEKDPQAKQIIICPASLLYNWQQELEKFSPDIRSVVYHGGQRKAGDLQDDTVQVVITSYGTFRADAGNLLSVTYGAAIIDESHNIKNPSAMITRSVSSLRADVCFALSGTPVVNNTFDLYSQLNIVLPGMFGTREFFKREYADAIDRFGDEEKIQALQKMTAPFILRRTKEQVAVDLPEKTESILWCHMPPSQRDLYEHIKSQVRGSLFLDIKQQGLAKSKLAVIHGILKLRQVCNSPMLLPEEDRQPAESVKTRLLMEELDNILPGHKALVFSQFSTMLDLLAEECKQRNIACYHFDGQTPPAKRAEMVKAFQEEGNEVNLFLISLKAGNAGLTLTAADYVFLFDPWWNTAVQQQAIDRTHRIGQTKNVFAYKMICKDTIEEKIIRLQQKKKQLADELISADEGFVKTLTEEDIAYLFE